MAKGGCRDCKMCTRSSLSGCMVGCFHLCTFGVFLILAGLGNAAKSKCPTCGHPLSDHHRREDGSFKD
jgi:hypothetical protein